MPPFLSRPVVRIGLISIFLSLMIGVIFLLPSNPGPYRAVPSQTSILIECNGLVKAGQQLLLVQDPAWKEVLKNRLFQNCWQEVGEVEQLFHYEPVALKAFAKNDLLAAFTLHPADSLHPLFILQAGAQVELDHLLKNNKLNLKFFPYQFHSQTLYTVHLPTGGRVVLAQKGSTIVFSRYSYLVEDALTQLESTRGWWADNRYLGDLSKIAPMRIFFRPSKWVAQQGNNLQPRLRGIGQVLSDNIAWFGVALEGQKVTTLCEPGSFLAGFGAWNGTKQRSIFSVLPENTALLAWAGFDNRALFFKALASKPSADFDRFILPWVGEEAALVVTEPLSDALSDDRLMIFSVRDSARARAALEAYGKARGLITHEQIGMFDVFGFQSQSLLTPFFSGPDPAFQNPYFVHLGTHVVVAPNRPAAEIFTEQYIANQTLVQNTDFLQLTQKFSSEAQGLILLNGGYLPKLLRQVFQDNSQQTQWMPEAQRLSGTGWLAAVINPGLGKKTMIDLYSQEQTQSIPESNIFWKTAIAAPAVTSVYAIPQPGMPIGTALLVQDKETRLYCLSPDGAVLWEKHLGSFILSPIRGIDYFQNGRKCYLFNTKSAIWILDENGKDVQGFPQQLKAPACTGLTVVDFDKNLKFNYFVPCENGNVYGFDLYGRALDGWNPQAGVGKSAGPMLHFQHNGKDYLAVLSDKGTLSVFGRDGKLRFAPLTLPGNFANGPWMEKTNGKPHWVCAEAAGNCFDIDLAGAYREKRWPVEKQPVKAVQMLWESSTVYALLQGKQVKLVKAAGQSWQIVAARQFAEKPDDVFPFETGLGLCSRSKQKIMLLDQAGKLAKGFPLAGSTPFGICQVGPQKLLISGNGSAVYAYKLAD